MEKRRIGIMGGTFDPPHIGHLRAAESVLNTLKLEKVVFVPTGSFAHKNNSETESAKHRLEMTKLLVNDIEKFEVSDIEVNSLQTSYTSETLPKLHKIYENSHLYFIVGADSLDYMENWKNPQIIFSYASVAVVNRNGFDEDAILKKADELKKRFSADIHIVQMENELVSSTEIRNRIKNGKPIEKMTTEKVIDYIYAKKLYIQKGAEND